MGKVLSKQDYTQMWETFLKSGKLREEFAKKVSGNYIPKNIAVSVLTDYYTHDISITKILEMYGYSKGSSQAKDFENLISKARVFLKYHYGNCVSKEKKKVVIGICKYEIGYTSLRFMLDKKKIRYRFTEKCCEIYQKGSWIQLYAKMLDDKDLVAWYEI